MQQTLQQVGTLLLGSLPTLILFILLVLAYQILVQGPLSKTLKDRRARTSGAVEHAGEAIAAAEARAEEYDNKLRQARMEIFRVREQRLKEWSLQRETTLDNARKAALKKVLEAKVMLQSEAESARKSLIDGGDELAQQVVRAVMPAVAGGSR
jgi:F-type H+-transporting ATPase subunit b